MKLDEYKKLIKEDEQNRRQYSREACLDRDFMTVITFFEITKHARGLRTIENILNSYKVTENVKDGE